MGDLARLVVPVACPGCGTPDVPWCAGCARLVTGGARRVETQVPRLDRVDDVAPLPVWALSRYEGGVRGLVVAWKDRGRTDLDRLLAPATHAAAARLAPAVGTAVGARPLLVVPAPSTAAARRERAREHLAPVARAVAGALGGRVAPVLRRGRGGDQVGLGARARGGNVAVRVDAGALDRARARAGGQGAPVCLLVDDVVTTGATLAAAERALGQAGADVVGALVLAATPAPGERARPRPRDLHETRTGSIGDRPRPALSPP
ncbi:ComF family protein [Xylanimonas oleitrophica]|uniref:ComF family protein n=1 Tax=Xylanimonas oleitrophica TaxID=2607479 RepID=A0A2W5WUN2_9MICO|nr:ComF family protein [Xylanimonas oleitrophica]